MPLFAVRWFGNNFFFAYFELFGDETLGDLVLDDGADPRLDVVKDVIHAELPEVVGDVAFAVRAAVCARRLLRVRELLVTLLKRRGLVGDEDEVVLARNHVVAGLLAVLLQGGTERGHVLLEYGS